MDSLIIGSASLIVTRIMFGFLCFAYHLYTHVGIILGVSILVVNYWNLKIMGVNSIRRE